MFGTHNDEMDKNITIQVLSVAVDDFTHLTLYYNCDYSVRREPTLMNHKQLSEGTIQALGS